MAALAWVLSHLVQGGQRVVRYSFRDRSNPVEFGRRGDPIHLIYDDADATTFSAYDHADLVNLIRSLPSNLYVVSEHANTKFLSIVGKHVPRNRMYVANLIGDSRHKTTTALEDAFGRALFTFVTLDNLPPVTKNGKLNKEANNKVTAEKKKLFNAVEALALEVQHAGGHDVALQSAARSLLGDIERLYHTESNRLQNLLNNTTRRVYHTAKPITRNTHPAAEKLEFLVFTGNDNMVEAYDHIWYDCSDKVQHHASTPGKTKPPRRNEEGKRRAKFGNGVSSQYIAGWMRDALFNPRRFVLVASVPSRTTLKDASFVCCEWRPGRLEVAIVCGKDASKPGRASRNATTALLFHVEDIARNHNVSIVFLQAVPTAVPYYARLGYQRLANPCKPNAGFTLGIRKYMTTYGNLLNIAYKSNSDVKTIAKHGRMKFPFPGMNEGGLIYMSKCVLP